MSGASRLGPHPDLTIPAIDLLNRSHADSVAQGLFKPSLASVRFEVLCQVTITDVDSPIFGRRPESAWLARMRHEDGDELVLAAGVFTPEKSDWHIEQMSNTPVEPDDWTSKPFFSASALGAPGRYIFGAVVNSPDLAVLRMILADRAARRRVTRGGGASSATCRGRRRGG